MVASGAEEAEGASIEPLTEMVYTKCGELVFEAVPGLVLQLIAVLNAKENTTSVFVSLVISTASAAFTGTTIFWDFDTDPKKRKDSVGHCLFTPPHPLPPFLRPFPSLPHNEAAWARRRTTLTAVSGDLTQRHVHWPPVGHLP